MFTFFLFNTLNFIVHVLIAYPAFIMGWLILDSKNLEKKKSLRNIYTIQTIGFWIIGAYMLFGYAYVDTGAFSSLFKSIMLLGLLAIGAGYYLEPFPTVEKSSKKKFLLYRTSKIVTGALTAIAATSIIALILDVFGIKIAGNFFNYSSVITLALLVFINIIFGLKYIVGLQKQHKSLLEGFIFFALAFLIEVINKFVFGEDLRFILWTKSFGVDWILEIIALAVGFYLIGKHALSFLRFRLKPQLFIGFIGGSLMIFFLVTVVFLVVLINDFQKNTLFNLEASSKAIELSIVESRNDTILASKALSDNEKVVSGIKTEESKIFSQAVDDILTLSGVDYIIVTNEAGISLYNTYDKESYGTNLSTDKYLLRALEGAPVNTIVIDQGVLSPTVTGKTFMPVVQNGKVLGAIIVGSLIDNQLVDSIKKQTGLEVTIFAGNIRAATTFTTEDGLNRLTGTVENDSDILETVLKKGETQEGIIDIFNVEHLAVYTPMRDSDQNIIGMIFVGEPSQVLIAVANNSVQTTLKITTLLIFLSLIPTYFIVKKIAERQII
jgi:hypothetical protein